MHLSLRHTPIHFACVARPIAQFGRDAERLHTWLVRDMGCNDPSMTRHQTAQQIEDRVLIKGFKCEIKLSDHVIKSSHSHFGDDKKRAFTNQKLTGNLTVDFTGIGPASLANLAAVGITNSDGLLAAFLSIIDNPNPMANTDKCDQFYEQLGRWKVASGFKATIIYQLQSKLAVGIDSSNEGELEMALRNYEDFHRLPIGSATVEQLQSSSAKIGGWLRAGPHFPSASVGIENCQQLDAIPEHSSPRTGEQSRALPPRALPPQTGRELFPSLDTEQAREAKHAAATVKTLVSAYGFDRASAERAVGAIGDKSDVELALNWLLDNGEDPGGAVQFIRCPQLAEKAAADVVEISRTEYMTGRAKQREAKQLAIASAGSMSAYAIPVALLAFVLAYLYWPLRLVALVLAYLYWRNSR